MLEQMLTGGGGWVGVWSELPDYGATFDEGNDVHSVKCHIFILRLRFRTFLIVLPASGFQFIVFVGKVLVVSRMMFLPLSSAESRAG